MTGAIDTVGDAIECARSKMGQSVPSKFLAERAILAMRNPTDEMMQVFAALPQHHNRLDMWCAMIDVALGRIKLVEETPDEERG